jgi:hypothetical protein
VPAESPLNLSVRVEVLTAEVTALRAELARRAVARSQDAITIAAQEAQIEALHDVIAHHQQKENAS